MEIFISILVGIIIIGIILFCFLKNTVKKNRNEEKEIGVLENIDESCFPGIQIIEDERNIPSEKNKIVDSDIKKAISIIDNTIPNAVMIGKNIRNSAEFLNKNRDFFSAAKRETKNMMRVKGTNEWYGTQMIGNKFSGQTKFIKENEMISQAGKDAIVNVTFSTASMVVGQYYMNEINNKLDDIRDEISEITNFLDSEYQGKLLKIISKMKEIIDNKVEILNNGFSKSKRYEEILNLESTCAELLGQANEMIRNNIAENDIDYKKYEKKIKEIDKWFLRQQILQMLLLEIGNLRYILANGNETSKLSHMQYNNYLAQSNSINTKLKEWHTLISKKLGIDIKASRMNGKFFEIKKHTIGKINENWAYHKLNNEIANLIESQTNIKKFVPYMNRKQDEVIKIQKYNGEYYNLLEEHTTDE